MDASPSVHQPRALRTLWLLPCIFAVVFAYLYSPVLPAGLEAVHCARYFELSSSGVRPTFRELGAPRSPPGFQASCDAPGFVIGAVRPSLLLTDKFLWQSRPLFIAAGSLLRLPFELVWPRGRAEAAAWGRGQGDRARQDRSTVYDDLGGRFLGAYVGYVTLNFLLLALAVMLFARIVGPSCRSPALLGSVAVLLVANDIAKIYVWTPHLQMLCILQPVVLTWLLLHVWNRPALSTTRLAAYALLCGVLPLAYGSFFLLLPGLVVGRLLRRGNAGPRPSHGEEARAIALATTLFFVPCVAWILTIHLSGGSFYSHETQRFRQVVWIFDALHDEGPGGLWLRASAGLRIFGRQVATVAGPTVLVVLGTALLAALVGRRRAIRDEAGRELAAAGIALMANLGFFSVIGYYSERLDFVTVPPLLVMLAVMLGITARGLPRSGARLLTALMVAGASLWTVHQVTKPGPWSYVGRAYSVTTFTHPLYLRSALEPTKRPRAHRSGGVAPPRHPARSPGSPERRAATGGGR